jgi:hypothetical protein
VPKSVSGDCCFSIDAFEVDYILWRRWLMWPMVVSGVSFKCLLMASSVKPGQVIICPYLTACNIAAFVGLNKAFCKLWTNAPVLRNSYTLFDMGSGIVLCGCFKLMHHRPVVTSRGPLNNLGSRNCRL